MTGASLRSLLPSFFSVAEGNEFRQLRSEFEAENMAVAGSVPQRAAEFFTARHGAREALSDLGIAPTAIPVGKDRSPVWPQGVAGSISHTGSYWCVAVAYRREVRSVGVDVEVNMPLPDEVHRDILTDNELRTVGALVTQFPQVSWDRLFFSIKESAYKCWYPQLGAWIDFVDCFVEIDVHAKVFRATLMDGIQVAGNWTYDTRHIITSGYAQNGRNSGKNFLQCSH